jgi:dUTPase
VPGIKISMFRKYVMNVNERSKFIFKKYLTAVCGVSFRLIDKIYH